jgi:ABC-type nitrate/sulfonate/bicarbonate transport system permease component
MASAEAETTETIAPRRKPRSDRSGILSAQNGLLATLLLLWQFLVGPESLPYFSRPSLIAARLFDLLSHQDIYRHISVTL